MVHASWTMKYSFINAALVAIATAHPSSPIVEKREAVCEPQPAGAGVIPSPGTPQAFIDYSGFPQAANDASTRLFNPDYYQSFSNLPASVSIDTHPGYLGYRNLGSYDIQKCGAYCSAEKGCAAFNIFFERDPSVNPGPGCEDPLSTTNIKCTLWANEIASTDATNEGQYRSKFEVAIAGSNGYIKYKGGRVSNYCPPTYLGNKATEDHENYIGFTNYPDQTTIDASKCASNCDSKAGCVFFDTYLESVDGVRQGQTCAYYSIVEQPSASTNDGQTRGTQIIEIWDSYSYAQLSTGDCD